MPTWNDPPILTQEHKQVYEHHPEVKFIWKCNPGACDKCKSLDGRSYSYKDIEERGRVHPNCLCSVEVDFGSIFDDDNYSISVVDFIDVSLAPSLAYEKFTKKYLPQRNKVNYDNCIVLWSNLDSEEAHEKCKDKLEADSWLSFGDFLIEWYLYGGFDKLKRRYGVEEYLP